MHLIAIVESPTEIAGACDLRRRELGLSNLCLDDVAGLMSGYSGKLFCGSKKMGEMSMPAMLGALGMRLVAVASEEWVPPVTRRHMGMTDGGGRWRNRPLLLPPPANVVAAIPGARHEELPAAPHVIALPYLPG